MKKVAGNPYLKAKNNSLYLDQVTINSFLKNCDTPIMIFLQNRIMDNINTFKEVFNSTFEGFEFFYSYKANFLPEIIEIITSSGVGAEVISLPELKLALKHDVPPDKILVGGPYLSNNLIIKSLLVNVKEIVIYNISDIKRVNDLAKKYNKIQEVCLRVNSSKYQSKLGINLTSENLQKLKLLIKFCKNIKIKTILSHFSTQMNSFQQFKKNIKAISIAYKDLENIGFDIRNLNLGGGFPEATVMPKSQLKKIATNIKTELESLHISYESIYFEPGRYLVGDSAVFLSKVINTDKERWIFLDIGNHICPWFAKCSLRFYNASRINAAHKFKVSIAGIVPTDQDVLAKNYFMTKKIDKGDLILVTNVGAYTLTFSNRFPYRLPCIFLVKDKDKKKIFDPEIDIDISLS
jgi:diaminopimelate decarboxylase